MTQMSNHIANFEQSELGRYLLAIREENLTDTLKVSEYAYTNNGDLIPGHFALEFRTKKCDLSKFWKTFESLANPHPRITKEAIIILFGKKDQT